MSPGDYNILIFMIVRALKMELCVYVCVPVHVLWTLLSCRLFEVQGSVLLILVSTVLCLPYQQILIG